MKWLVSIMRVIGMTVLLIFLLLAFVYFPRLPILSFETRFSQSNGGIEYEVPILENPPYSIVEHFTRIKDYIVQVFETKSLGNTRFGTTVEAELISTMSYSLVIIVSALLIGFVFGVLKGFFDFKTQHSKLNIFGNWTTWLFQSVPDFLLILLAQVFFIRYFPIFSIFDREGLGAYLLPACLVAIYPMMYIARVTSTLLNGQSGQLYIQVARAKGMPERVVLYKHVFRNCIGTILSHLPSLMMFILTNLTVVEYFMNYPGAANRLIVAIDYHPGFNTGQRYEPGIIAGILFCFTTLIIVVEVISQLAKKYFEPRKVESTS